MKVLSMATLSLLLLLGAMPAAAQENVSLETVMRALEAPFRATDGPGAIRDFQAQYQQESYSVSLDQTRRARGEVAVQFPPAGQNRPSTARFHWKQQEPDSQLFISDGQTLWAYLPENRQVMQSDIDAVQARPDDPMAFLTGLGNLSRDFQVSWAEPARNAEGDYVLDLRPRTPSAVLQRLQVVVDRQAVAGKGKKAVFPLRAVTVVDPLGNLSRFTFANPRVNQGLPPALFRFEPPPGVEVVRPSLPRP